jgi:hypothetical protein
MIDTTHDFVVVKYWFWFFPETISFISLLNHTIGMFIGNIDMLAMMQYLELKRSLFDFTTVRLKTKTP